jgi:hypothetical protein
MFNIITLILIVAASLSPQGLKPAHLQEYNLVGEIPEILVTAPRYNNNTEISELEMMPEILVTASKITADKTIGEIPEVLITASRYNINSRPSANGMMPEVQVTAKRNEPDKTLLVQHKEKSEKEG